MGGVKGKIINLFKINTTKNYSKLTHVNNVYEREKKPRKPKIKKQSEGRIIRVIKNLSAQEEDYYKQIITDHCNSK